jgi:glycosyltransferase involved in cell wall biosynthesis
MTSFNSEKFISDAINSVLKSSFKDFELIIVDDLSADGTVEIAKKFELEDDRVRVYVNDVNLGDYFNRNVAAGYAKGKYIKYIDADDMIYPWGLEIIIKYFELFPMASYCLDSIDQDPLRIFPFVLSPAEAYEREYFLSSVFNKAPTSATIKLDVFKKIGGFTGKRMVGDFELWHKLSSTEFLLLLPHGLVWSRRHDGQESKLMRLDSIWLFQYMLISLRFLSMGEIPLDSKKKEVALNRIKKKMARSIWRSIIFEFNFAKAREKKVLSKLSLSDLFYFGLIYNK